MTKEVFTIGRLAKESRCKVQTIRYYEQIKLMPKPARSEGNQRQYKEADLERLVFIRHSRELGFSIGAIRQLLGLADDPNRSCEEADRLARVHLLEVETRITRLNTLKQELERMIEECKGGRVADCRIIGVLANHAFCLTEDHVYPTV